MEDRTVTMTEIVLPNDTNPLGILLGGRLLYWMDIAAAICAQNHAGKVAVTVSIDSVSFDCPIRLGDVTYIIARLTRVFRTSLEIYVEVFKKETGAHTRQKANEAYFTFVALGGDGRPTAVEPIFPKNREEQMLFDAALERRDTRKNKNKKDEPI